MTQRTEQMQSGQKPVISILGLGLMGGSLGLTLTRAGFPVTGWARNPATLKEALRIGAISRIPATLEEAVSGADYIFVGTPVTLIGPIIRECLPFTKSGAVFSDLGSIKEAVMAEVFSFLPDSRYFVAAHPMTGSEQQGIAAADPFLYQNATYIIIDDPRTPVWAAEKVKDILRFTGANLIHLTAAEHDRIVAMVSHLPHLMAATLAKTAGLEEKISPGTLNLAAGGFRDTTRIATGSPDIWDGIILGNRYPIIRAIDAFQKQLDLLKNILNGADQTQLKDFLEQARRTRTQIPAKNKGFLTLLHEMVVTIEDRPGAIEEILHYLAEKDLNIKDIEILRVREGEGGTLRLALENSADVDRAIVVLETEGFKVKRR